MSLQLHVTTVMSPLRPD